MEESVKDKLYRPEIRIKKDTQKRTKNLLINHCKYKIDSRTRTKITVFRAPNKNSEIKFKLPHAQNVFLVDSMIYGNNEVYYQITMNKKIGWVKKKNIKANCK